MQRKNKIFKNTFKKFFLLFLYSVLLFIISISLYAQSSNDNIDHYFSLEKIKKDFEFKVAFNIFENILIFISENKELKIYIKKNIAIFDYKIFNSKIPVIIIKKKEIYILDYFIYIYYNVFFIAKYNIEFYNRYFSNFNLKYNYNILLSEKQKEEFNYCKNNKSKISDRDENEREVEISKRDNNSSNLIRYAKKEIIEYRKIKYIIIDPGHGGKDPGAIYYGIKEKDINLYVAKKLKIYLSKTFKGLKIILTREDDEYISLEQRVKIANKYNNEFYTGIFISIHANASSLSKNASGLEIYYLDYNLVDEKIKNLVKYENKEIENPLIGNIINRLLNEELIFESKKIASYIFNEYAKKNSLIKAKSINGAPFFVLAYTSLPAILIELGYLSNKNDSKNILSKNFLENLFKAIEKGLEEYINEYNKTKGFKNIKK